MEPDKILIAAIAVTLIIFITTPEDNHKKITKEINYQTQSLVIAVDKLEKEVDELRNEEARLIGLIEISRDSNKFTDAKRYINLLLLKHPESQKKQYYSSLLPEIEQKASEEQAELEKKK